MLGKDLTQVLTAAGHVCLGSGRDIDISELSAVEQWLQEHPVDCIVNCAAYTAVDKAESEEPLAFAVNAQGPQNLAQASAARHIGIIHISTDYVLNGAPPQALRESEPMAPQGAYGRTKAKGELRIQAMNPEHWIIRTAWLYGIHGNNFVKTMLRFMAERESLAIVDDQWGSPTWTMDLAHAIGVLLAQPRLPGVYHYSGQGQITWCTFAKEIQRQALELGILTRGIPIAGIPSSQYPSPAKRPMWSVLDKSLIQETFGVTIPDWKESLQQYLQLERAARA